MRIIGFELTKISAEKLVTQVTARPSTTIEFTELKDEPNDILKEGKILKISFKYLLIYEEQKKEKEGEIAFNGNIILSITDDELKEIKKHWKKKKLPNNTNIFLFNLVLRRCTPKAIFLEDEISLPIHTPMPKLEPKKEEQTKN